MANKILFFVVLIDVINCQTTISTTEAIRFENSLETTTILPNNQSNQNNFFKLFNETEFDVEFYNDTYFKSLQIYQNENETKCEIDYFFDKLFPENYETDHEFNFDQRIWTKNISETFEIVENLVKLSNDSNQNFFTPLSKRIISRLSFLLLELKVSKNCMTSLMTIAESMGKNELWSLKFLDSIGKIPHGMLEGTLSSVGDYNQCLQIKSPNSKKKQFYGKYCMMRPILPHPFGRITINDNVNDKQMPLLPFKIPKKFLDDISDALYFFNRTVFNFGICIPSTCTAKEIETSINSILYPITRIPIEIGPETRCDSIDKPLKIDPYQWMAIYVYVILFLLTIFASIYEYFSTKNGDDSKQINHISNNNIQMINIVDNGKESEKNIEQKQRQQSMFSKIIIAFSLKTNIQSLFQQKPNNFGSIDFIRFVMLMKTILMHTYYVSSILTPAIVLQKKLFTGLTSKLLTENRYGFIRNFHTTDFFFSLTGLLMAYSMLKSLKRNKGKFNFIQYLINIYLRFYPSIFGVICLYYLLPLIDDGPFWHHMDQYYVYPCRKQLLSSMLSYNFYDVDLEFLQNHQFCNMASWWANSCFHLAIIFPVIIIPLSRFTKQSYSFLYLIFWILLGFAISIGFMIWSQKPYVTQFLKMDSLIYDSLYTAYFTWPFIFHISTFVYGIFVGYLLLYLPDIYFGGLIGEIILTFVFITMTLIGFNWTIKLHSIPREIIQFLMISTPNLDIYLNITVGKLLWCTGFMWIFYICCTKREFWSKLFNFPSLRPFYNLALQIYLINFLPSIWLTFRSKDMIEIDDIFIYQQTIANVCITIALSFIVYLLFDKPVQNLLRIFQFK